MKFVYLVLLFVIYVFCTVEAERTKKKIYVNISGRKACFRRFNATHQIGCTSDSKGNVGVVHFIDTPDDLSWLLDTASDKPYAVLLRPNDFNMTTLGLLRASGKVNGIMIIHVKENQTHVDTPASFSPDKSCPNDQHGLYSGNTQYGDCKKAEWNPDGSGMMFEDIGFPIFVMTNDKEVTFIIEKCYKKFNLRGASGTPSYPLCAVQLKDRMDGAKDSETCIRRTRHQVNLSPMRYCDPMGDQNVFATVKAINNTQTLTEKSVILAAARLDSFSMFEDFYPSADNHISGIVALLAAAEAIGKVKDAIIEKADSKDIMFTFFQGEAFDYIGSERMVYDMEANEFPRRTGGAHMHPMDLSHISEVIEVNQVAYRDGESLWIHTDPISRKIKSISDKINEMIGRLTNISQSVHSVMKEVDQSQPLPPASVQSFLKKKNISAVVITDHKLGYTNKYYNSRFDIASAIGADYPTSLNKTDWYDHVTDQANKLAGVSTVLAQYLYKQATSDDAPASLVVDNKTVTHLLYCFLYSPNCELFQQVMSAEKAKALGNEPYQFYVGVEQQTNNVTSLVWRLLMNYLGDRVNIPTKDKCDAPDNDQIYQYTWMQGPVVNGTKREPFCMKGTANFSSAISKAFEIDDYDWGSGQFSTWTESAWANDAMDVRLFLIPSKKFETTTLSVGVVIMLLSMLFVYLFNRKTDTLFSHATYHREY